VNYLKNYIIPFKGLSFGVHDYNWEIDKKFFEAIENTEINEGNLTVDLNLEKQERMMIFSFSITGEIKTQCDRCLDDLYIPIELNEVMYYKFGLESKEESDDVIILSDNEYQIDISELINEYIILSLPLKKVHPADENGNNDCNKEVIKKLEELSEKKTIDPRWEQLKNLKLD